MASFPRPALSFFIAEHVFIWHGIFLVCLGHLLGRVHTQPLARPRLWGTVRKGGFGTVEMLFSNSYNIRVLLALFW